LKQVELSFVGRMIVAKEEVMVWVLILVIGGVKAGGAIEKVAYYPTQDDCAHAADTFGPGGQGIIPRTP
jgi:hypothetical protein